jgi:tRNA threonylcarbamoyl adenosine modification protein YeaZ
MKVLAIELSSARGSLAWSGEKGDVKREWPNDRKNSSAFFQSLQDVTEECGLPDTIVVGLGPGSYAGTRIAISAAIGLQAAGQARLIGLPSICAIETESEEYGVIGDARRHSFFFARIRTNNLVEGPILLTEDELRETLGPLNTPVFTSESLPQFARAELRYPSAAVLARLARQKSGNVFVPPLEPMYLREPHITVPKNLVRSRTPSL